MALFHQIDFDLQTLVAFIDRGYVGLPDIQRPFVWPNTKIRDLFDSLYRGYPVGYLLLWENGVAQDSRTIGSTPKQSVPSLLIVDGQQRLTALYAVLTGTPVVREDYSTERIEIAFDPLHENFEVADAAIRRDRSFVPDISALWRNDGDIFETWRPIYVSSSPAERSPRMTAAGFGLHLASSFNCPATFASPPFNCRRRSMKSKWRRCSSVSTVRERHSTRPTSSSP